jgi:hypothetical protein
MSKVKNNPKAADKEKTNQEAIAATSKTSVQSIVDSLGSTRVSVNNVLSELEETLITKRNMLDTVETAIEAQKQQLKDIYEIIAQADTLAELVAKEEVFKAENEAKRAQWAIELDEMVRKADDKAMKLDSLYKRMEEEYDYNLRQLKKKSQDEFDQQKVIRLRELSEKIASSEAVLATKHAELNAKLNHLADLEAQVSKFPQQLSDAVNEAKDKAAKTAAQSWGFEKRALEQTHEKLSAVQSEKINNLTEKVAQLVDENKSLRSSLEKANEKVETIATKAIEGAQQKVYHTTQVTGNGSGKSAS